MSHQERYKRAHWLLFLAWVSAGILVLVGATQGEVRLEDPNTIALLEYGLSKGDIEIVQAKPDQPLTIQFFNPNPPPPALSQLAGSKGVFSEDEWNRVGKLIRQFVAIANWGLGDPFLYERREDGSAHVRAFHSKDFVYVNPFERVEEQRMPAPITSSRVVDERRRGWRVVGPDVLLFLKANAPEDEVSLEVGDGASRGVCRIARRFSLRSSGGAELRLSIGDAAVAEDSTTRLQLEALDSGGRPTFRQLVNSGESFFWNDQTFVAYNPQSPPRAAAAPPDSPAARGDAFSLVFTKQLNNGGVRMHTLGEATTNLIGASVGGYTPYLDGAIRHDLVAEVTLTLDPELQAASFYLLRDALLKLDGVHFLGRPRRGSVTVLDLDRGAVVAQSGYPSFEADWARGRRVLIDRDALTLNPANEPHMAGSTVKVLTVAAGYLLFGHAQSELLPASNNAMAVKQAFQDAYRAELSAPLEGARALVTPEARSQFQALGGPRRVSPEFVGVLRNVFLLEPDKDEQGPREQLVSAELLGYFDEPKLTSEFLPRASYFPVLNADSMERFRHYALGTEDTRMTTLRVAAVLGTATTGRVIRPYIVEGVLDRDFRPVRPQLSAFGEIDLPLSDLRFRRSKMLEITQALHKVLLPGGTGYFFTDGDKLQYLGADNPETPSVNEAESRKGDFGKSGTADYGSSEPFQDSLFVYRHGNYVISVWLEKADKGEDSDSGQRPFERHPAHKLTDQIVHLLESLEDNDER